MRHECASVGVSWKSERLVSDGWGLPQSLIERQFYIGAHTLIVWQWNLLVRMGNVRLAVLCNYVNCYNLSDGIVWRPEKLILNNISPGTLRSCDVVLPPLPLSTNFKRCFVPYLKHVEVFSTQMHVEKYCDLTAKQRTTFMMAKNVVSYIPLCK